MQMGIFKKNSVLIAFVFLFISIPFRSMAIEDVEFIKTKEWKLHKIGTEKIVLTCKVVFFNPNKVKAKLKDVNLNITINDTKVGKVLQAEKKVKIKKNAAFEIPLRIEVKPETNAWGYIEGILSLVTLQDFVVRTNGHIKLKALGIPLKIGVQDETELSLKAILVD